ncbi:MAG: arginine--tRNA ligase [Candidatus Omnitrophota bacterium]
MLDIESITISLLEESLKKLRGVFSFDASPSIDLDIPKESAFGDLSSNIALKLGRQIRHPAKELAHIMVDGMKVMSKELPYSSLIKDIEVRGPGFINFFIKEEALCDIMDRVMKEGKKYGSSDIGKGVKINVEFASANPTGPLTIAHGRQAAFGDSLTNILRFSGFAAEKEYYINDEGRQIDLLGRSIQARYLELIGDAAELPQDGYRGDYIIDIAGDIKERHKDSKRDAPLSFFTDRGYKDILNGIKLDLKDFGVSFDIWFSQRHLGASGKVEKAIELLKEKELTYEKEGALWLRSTGFGDEKDRVIIKSDGSYTYFGPDIAYHIDKYKRGFKKLIDIWGPDHHGYIPRMKAAMEGLGYEKGSVNPLIVQLVTLYRGKTPVPMSTRAGSFVTLKEVMTEIGADAARFFFLRRKRDSHLDFDLELAKKHSLDNPIYYIQYAHARISSIIEFEKKETKIPGGLKPDSSLLQSKEELNILRVLRQFPFVAQSSAAILEPYRVLIYLEDLAKSFHSFYNKHRVVSDDYSLSAARLQLVECVRIVIANGLKLIGVSAPTKM